MSILKKLLTPRSIMALVIVSVFAHLAVKGMLNTDSVMMVFTLVLGYWFGREQKETIEKKGDD